MKLSAPHVVLIGVITVGVGLHCWAAIDALGSSACPGPPGCYPWGAEGPAAGTWRYKSQENYVAVNFGQAILLIGFGVFLMRYLATEDRIRGRAGIWALVAAWAALFLL